MPKWLHVDSVFGLGSKFCDVASIYAWRWAICRRVWSPNESISTRILDTATITNRWKRLSLKINEYPDFLIHLYIKISTYFDVYLKNIINNYCIYLINSKSSKYLKKLSQGTLHNLWFDSRHLRIPKQIVIMPKRSIYRLRGGSCWYDQIQLMSIHYIIENFTWEVIWILLEGS